MWIPEVWPARWERRRFLRQKFARDTARLSKAAGLSPAMRKKLVLMALGCWDDDYNSSTIASTRGRLWRSHPLLRRPRPRRTDEGGPSPAKPGRPVRGIDCPMKETRKPPGKTSLSSGAVEDFYEWVRWIGRVGREEAIRHESRVNRALRMASRQPGDALSDWLEAEREVDGVFNATKQKVQEGPWSGC